MRRKYWNHRLKEQRAAARTVGLEQLRELGLTSPSQAIEYLRNTSETVEIKVLCCQVLGNLRVRDAVLVLSATLGGAAEPELIWAAAHALVAIDSRHATTMLLPILRSPSSATHMQAAVYVLGFLRDWRSRGALKAIAFRDNLTVRTRGLAIEALSTDPKAKAMLMEMLDHRFPHLRYSALCAISPWAKTSDVAKRILSMRQDPGLSEDGYRIGDLAADLSHSVPVAGSGQ